METLVAICMTLNLSFQPHWIYDADFVGPPACKLERAQEHEPPAPMPMPTTHTEPPAPVPMPAPMPMMGPGQD